MVRKVKFIVSPDAEVLFKSSGCYWLLFGDIVYRRLFVVSFQGEVVCICLGVVVEASLGSSHKHCPGPVVGVCCRRRRL